MNIMELGVLVFRRKRLVDYNDLLERLAVSAGDQECLYADAKATIKALQTRLAESEDTNKTLRVRLGSELHEPVTTIDDRHNADGKSCHITDDLPAGVPLYTTQPIAAPVRPNDSELEMIARAHGTGGWQTLGDIMTFARAIKSAVLHANGFKLECEQ